MGIILDFSFIEIVEKLFEETEKIAMETQKVTDLRGTLDEISVSFTQMTSVSDEIFQTVVIDDFWPS